MYILKLTVYLLYSLVIFVRVTYTGAAQAGNNIIINIVVVYTYVYYIILLCDCMGFGKLTKLLIP